jgi:hypothetical protein
MADTEHTIPTTTDTRVGPERQEAPDKRPNRLLNNRFAYAILSGVLLALLSSAVVGINLSANNNIPVNDTINRYFDTCVGEGFGSATPLIQTQERGFPLAHYTSSKVPLCDNFVELKRDKIGTLDLGSLLANILIWTAISYAVMRRLSRRQAA